VNEKGSQLNTRCDIYAQMQTDCVYKLDILFFILCNAKYANV